MSKKGLGRGLSALIPSMPQETAGETRELPIEAISPNPRQPRTEIDDEKIAELADSVTKVGILQPIIVRPFGEGFQIVAGERRWRAAKSAGLDKVPVVVLMTTDTESLELALIENLQREDLNAIEEARGYKRLLTEHQLTQAELADKVSKSRSAITNALRLLDLPEEVQDLVYEGRLSAGHARAILTVPDDEQRTRLARKSVQEGLSVREVENLSRLIAAGQNPERRTRPVTPTSFKIIARKLRRLLTTNVRVKQGEKKGKIEIDFVDEEDLGRIVRLLTEGGDGEEKEA